ncbi:MAG: MFS transporter [Deltaproteobacteria bacterium]|nr:MFS transporter [Deltaproteobacteria bacterium]
MTKKIFYGWWIVLSSSLLGLYVGGTVFYGFTAFFLPIKEEFGWSHTLISLAGSLQIAEVGLFAPLAGFLADRFGARRLIIWGIITVGIGLLILSRTQTLFVFYLSVLLTAFGAGGCTAVVLTTAIANWFHKKIGTALGLMGAGVGGSGLIVMLIPPLIQQFQWRTTLVILALGTWVLCIPLALMIRSRPEEYGEVPDGNLAASSVRQSRNADKGIEMGFKEALRNKTFIYLNIAELMRMMAITAVALHVMPYLDSIGISVKIGGVIAGAIPLCGIAGRLGFGWLSDKISKRYVLAMTYGLLSLGTLAFAYAQAIWPIFLFLLCFPLGHGGSMVLRGAIVRDYFGRASFGKLIGIILGAGGFGGIIGPLMGGGLYDMTGSYNFVWPILSVLTGLATVMILRMK